MYIYIYTLRESNVASWDIHSKLGLHIRNITSPAQVVQAVTPVSPGDAPFLVLGATTSRGWWQKLHRFWWLNSPRPVCYMAGQWTIKV